MCRKFCIKILLLEFSSLFFRERELRDAMLYFALLATDIHLRTRRKDIPNVYNTSKNNNSENCIDVRFSMALFVPFLAMLVIVLRGKISLA